MHAAVCDCNDTEARAAELRSHVFKINIAKANKHVISRHHPLGARLQLSSDQTCTDLAMLHAGERFNTISGNNMIYNCEGGLAGKLAKPRSTA